jgi:outer membrane protein OmpA-like peptidoglycan-associated protein
MPERPDQTVVVLLPDSESGTVGRATVSNPSGTTDLAAARESTTASANQPPAPAAVMSEADVQAVFGDALAALPPPSRRVTLYFRFESDELTDESRALVPEILKAVKDQPAPDVVVIGHTDTTGSSAFNFELGLKRATAVRSILVEAGLDEPSVEVTTLGEADLLVPTADEVPEPRNRRVEIIVR